MENLPYTVNYTETNKETKLCFSGQLIINYIEKITALVNEKLQADKDLVVEIDKPESIDVTFIQLVLAVKATIKANGKDVSINTELSDELKTLVKNSGFNYVLN